MEFKYTGMIKCPRCGTENPVGSAKCFSCERILVSSGPVKMRTDYRIALGSWAIILTTVGVFYFYYLDEAARQEGFIRDWIHFTRTPFDILCDTLGHTEWKVYWAVGSVVLWTAAAVALGAVINLVRNE